MYIALFSHFIPCGVYEAVYILDGLIKNESDVQPDTVHGDTYAQIGQLKKLVFFRPAKQTRHRHIDTLFGESIDWSLISPGRKRRSNDSAPRTSHSTTTTQRPARQDN
jgi:hypothetical protein